MKKRILTIVLSLILALPLLCFNFACDGNNDAQEMASVVGDNYEKYLNKTFNNTIDAADVQGYNGWYYYCGTPRDNDLEKMIFQASSGRWCSSHNQLYYDTYIWGAWLPDGQTGKGIGMSFMAPATGTIRCTVTMHVLCDTTYLSSNGVRLEVTDKNGSSYGKKTIKDKSEIGVDVSFSILDIKLSKGAEVFFMLYSRSGNENCFTNVDITVQYTGAI